MRIPKPRPRLLDKRHQRATKATDWRKVRAVVLTRDRHKCRACGDTYGLDVHHVIMRSLGGKSTKQNLIILCRNCHQSVHGHVLILHWVDAKDPAKTVRFEWIRED